MLAFASALALLTGVVFGAVPAWFATRTDPMDALRGAGRSTGDRSSLTRTTLLVVQATVSVVLVAGSMMLARSLGNLERQDMGYEIDGRVLVALNRPPATYTAEKLDALNRDLEERLTALPGVQGAGLALYNPLTDNWGELVLVAGHPAPGPDDEAGASWDRVSANYLQNLGVKLARGRYFSTSDNATSEHVAVVNEAFVRRFFKTGEEPLDQHFGLDLPENVNTYRIVGIVRDARFAGFQIEPAAAADVLRAAGADGRLSEPDDAPAGVPVALRARRAARHEHADRHASSRWSSARSRASIRTSPSPASGRCSSSWIARSISSAPSRALPACSGWSRSCSRRSASTASPPTPSRSGPTRSASAWRSAPGAGWSSGWC